jgi:hypothetical protein
MLVQICLSRVLVLLQDRSYGRGVDGRGTSFHEFRVLEPVKKVLKIFRDRLHVSVPLVLSSRTYRTDFRLSTQKLNVN